MDGVKEVDEQEALSRLEEALNCAMAVQNTAYDIWLASRTPRGQRAARAASQWLSLVSYSFSLKPTLLGRLRA